MAPDTEDKPAANEIVALPLGGRVKIDPWSDDLYLLKSAPVGNISERDKMPFEITPFMLYLTRQEDHGAEERGASRNRASFSNCATALSRHRQFQVSAVGYLR